MSLWVQLVKPQRQGKPGDKVLVPNPVAKGWVSRGDAKYCDPPKDKKKKAKPK